MACADPLLRDAIVALRRTAAEGRLELVNRLTYRGSEARAKPGSLLLDGLTNYQGCVHRIFEEAFDASDTMVLAAAIDLKIGAIGLSQAVGDFNLNWSGRNVRNHWPEYRLSASRMYTKLHTVLDDALDIISGQDRSSADHVADVHRRLR